MATGAGVVGSAETAAVTGSNAIISNPIVIPALRIARISIYPVNRSSAPRYVELRFVVVR